MIDSEMVEGEIIKMPSCHSIGKVAAKRSGDCIEFVKANSWNPLRDIANDVSFSLKNHVLPHCRSVNV